MTKDEQTIANLKKLKSVHNGSYGADIDRAIKALDQESVLDKIRAEIEELDGEWIPFWDVVEIIDKYRAESVTHGIIHCRKCKHHHYDSANIPYCDRINYGYGWKDDDFCSKAESDG